MAHQRVYLPLTGALLRTAREQQGFGEPPLRGHAATPQLARELGSDDQEETEYAAMVAAGLSSLTLLSDADPPRRVVAAVDVPRWEAAEGDDPSAVLVPTPVPWRRLAAVHVDGPEAVPDVQAARRGDAEAVGRCLDHEPGWYGVQEIDDLLQHLGLGSPPGRATIG